MNYTIVDADNKIVSYNKPLKPGPLAPGFRLLPNRSKPNFDPITSDIQLNPITDESTEVTYKVIDKPLEVVKALKIGYFNELRNHKELSGFPYNGYVFDSDPISVQRISIAAQAAQLALSLGQPFSINWTTANNEVVTLSAMEMLEVVGSIASYANSLHTTCRSLKDSVSAATTVEELRGIVWPTSETS